MMFFFINNILTIFTFLSLIEINPWSFFTIRTMHITFKFFGNCLFILWISFKFQFVIFIFNIVLNPSHFCFSDELILSFETLVLFVPIVDFFGRMKNIPSIFKLQIIFFVQKFLLERTKWKPLEQFIFLFIITNEICHPFHYSCTSRSNIR